MGAWGHGPFDNDSALDWLDSVENDVCKHIAKQLSRSTSKKTMKSLRSGKVKIRGGKTVDLPKTYVSYYDYHETIAACALLAEQCDVNARIKIRYQAFKDELFDKAIRALEEMAKDRAWLDEWKEPRTIEKNLTKLIRQLNAIKKAEHDRQPIVVSKKYSHGKITKRIMKVKKPKGYVQFR